MAEIKREQPKTPLTEDVIQDLINRGYSATDLSYLGSLSKEDVLAFNPKEFSEFADIMAEHDDKLLGC